MRDASVFRILPDDFDQLDPARRPLTDRHGALGHANVPSQGFDDRRIGPSALRRRSNPNPHAPIRQSLYPASLRLRHHPDENPHGAFCGVIRPESLRGRPRDHSLHGGLTTDPLMKVPCWNS